MKINYWKIFVVLIILALSQNTWGKEVEKSCVDIILSSDLKPYMQVLDGFRETFPGRARSFILEKSPADAKHIAKLVEESHCPVLLTVGFKAASFSKNFNKKKVFSLILYHFLYPELLSSFQCGVHLEIPPEKIAKLCSKLLDKPRVGVFFSISGLEDYISEIAKAVRELGGFLKAVKVNSKTEFSTVLKSLLRKTDILLLLPDPILSSEEIVEWIVLRAVAQRKLVVGYNRFFLDIGAAAAFVVDYKETGRETAKLVEQLLGNGTCESLPAVYREIINYKVLKRLR